MKKLTRSQNDRVILGVCGGVGRSLGLPPDLVRVVWLLTVPLGGAGLVVYGAACLLAPESADEEEAPAGERASRNGGLLLVAFAVLVYLAQSGFDTLLPWGWVRTWGTLLPLVIFCAGVLLLWPRARQALGFSAERKVHRSVSDRVVAGVCGGIAREAGLDATMVRLGFVLAGAVTWVALLVYVLLVLVLPEEAIPGREPAPPTPVPDAPGPDQGSSEPGR